MNKSILALFTITLLSGAILLSNTTSAESSTSNASVTVPEACTMTGSGMNSHTATITPGTFSAASGSDYENGIGKTTFTVVCNDYNGFAIYAIGYTGDSYDDTNHTKLVGNNTNIAIDTAVYSSGDTTSSWSMKVNKVTDSTISYLPANMFIQNSFDSWHTVPDTYTKVAQYKASTGSSTTDTTLGAKIDTTYAAFIAPNQPGDTYVGQVKYTMVHPYTEEAAQPQISDSGKICYYANASNVVGTMGCQTISDYTKDWSPCVKGTDYSSYCYNDDYYNIISSLSDADAAKLSYLASNYSRAGYGFAGWSDKFDYATNNEAHFYGPQEDLYIPDTSIYDGEGKGLSLYAVWVKSAGTLQDSSKVLRLCGTGQGSLVAAPTDGTANLSSVSALTDQRDNQTYAIAKLADGRCWMIENLRLESTAAHNSDGTLAQGYGTSATYGNFSGLADAESANFSNSYTANSLYYINAQSGTASIGIGTTDSPSARMPRYNNMNTSLRASYPTTNNTSMYSYGNYYTWAAAIADTTYNQTFNNHLDTTSLCPSGWRLPHGGRTTVDTAVEFYLLSKAIMNNIGPDQGATDGYGYYGNGVTNTAGQTAAIAIRSFPNNFVYSGFFFGSSTENSRGRSGSYWTPTVNDYLRSYRFVLSGVDVYPGTSAGMKYYGCSVRCTVSAST